MRKSIVSPRNPNTVHAKWLRFSKPLLLAVIFGLVLACQITSLPVVPNIPFLGPTATPPSAQAVLSKAMAILRDAKSIRITITADGLGSTTLNGSSEFVSPDRIRFVYEGSGNCKNNEDSESIIVGQILYSRCGSGAWGKSQIPAPANSSIFQQQFVPACVPSGSVTFTKLGSNNVWSVPSDCSGPSIAALPRATGTLFVDPQTNQLRKLVIEAVVSGARVSQTYEFSDYNSTSIAINAPSAANIATSTPIPPKPWNLYAIDIKRSQPNNGFIQYDVRLALQNDSDHWQYFSGCVNNGTVETQEGFTYPVSRGAPIYCFHLDPCSGKSLLTPLSNLQFLPVPPHFRLVGQRVRGLGECGGEDMYLDVTFRAAQTAQPTRLKIPGFRDVDLTSPKSFAFPTDRPRSDFKNLGDTLEIPGKARLKISRVSTDTSSGSLAMNISLEFHNLNPGYQTKIDFYCGAVGKSGIVSVKSFSPSAGPSQTVKMTDTIYIGSTDKSFQNAKLFCSEFNGAFNLD